MGILYVQLPSSATKSGKITLNKSFHCNGITLKRVWGIGNADMTSSSILIQLDMLDEHITSKLDNPCVVLPLDTTANERKHNTSVDADFYDFIVPKEINYKLFDNDGTTPYSGALLNEIVLQFQYDESFL